MPWYSSDGHYVTIGPQKTVLTFNSVSNLTASEYIGTYGISATIGKCEVVMSKAGYLTNMYGYITVVPGGTAAQIITMYKNEASTSLALGFSAAVQTATSTAVTVNQGDLITLYNVQSNSPTPAIGGVSIEYYS